METVQAWGRTGHPIELGDIVLVSYSDDRDIDNPFSIVTQEFVDLIFDMSMPLIPEMEYILRIDDLIWFVICTEEKMRNKGKTIHYRYKFKRVKTNGT